MANILITGLTDKIDGVGIYIYNILSNFESEDIFFDFLVQGDKGIALEKQIKDTCKNAHHFFQVPLLKKGVHKSFKFLKKIYKENVYDLIYVNASLSTDLLYVLPFKNRKTKLVVHSHNSMLYGKEKQHYLFRKITSNSSIIKIACSDKAAEWMFKNVKNTKIIHNGIDTAKYTFSQKYRNEVREQYQISDDTLVIGHIGRLTYQKNQEFLLDISKYLASINIDFKVMMVGEGENKEMLESRVNALNLSDYVIFTGTQTETYKYYSAFDFFVMPSRYEGLPIVGIEAQASGLVCLFSDTIDKQVLLTDRANVINGFDSNEWGDSICYLSNHNEYKREGYSVIVASKGYDIKETVREIENLIHINSN